MWNTWKYVVVLILKKKDNTNHFPETYTYVWFWETQIIVSYFHNSWKTIKHFEDFTCSIIWGEKNKRAWEQAKQF